MLSGPILPNILVTGTPGTGKTTFSALLAQQLTTAIQAKTGNPNLGYRHVELSRAIGEHKLYKKWDYELNCSIFDDDMVNDYLEPLMAAGGVIVDFHSSDFFPERFFAAVFVLLTDNTVLYDRLAARGYPEAKVQLNVECEIMEVCKAEAIESYRPEIICELTNNREPDMAANLGKAFEFLKSRGLFAHLSSNA